MFRKDLRGIGRPSILLPVEALPPVLRTHFLEPRGAAPLEGADGRGSASNEACGDRLELGLWMEGETLARAAFQARGCSSLIAAASLVCERLSGRSRADFASVDPEAWLTEAGGLPPRGAHAGAVVRRAWQAAVQDLPTRYP